MVKWLLSIGINYDNYHIKIICHAAKIMERLIKRISQFGHVMGSNEIFAACPGKLNISQRQ